MLKTALRTLFVVVIFLEILGIFGILPPAPDFTWLGLLATVIFIWVVLELLSPPPFLWALTFLAVIIDGVSALLSLYSTWWIWDILVHMWGGVIIGSLGIVFITEKLKKHYLAAKRKDLFIIISVILITMTTGFLYECVEYLVDRFQYGYPKTLNTAYDTVEDQVSNLTGTLLVLSIYFIHRKLKKKKTATT